MRSRAEVTAVNPPRWEGGTETLGRGAGGTAIRAESIRCSLALTGVTAPGCPSLQGGGTGWGSSPSCTPGRPSTGSLDPAALSHPYWCVPGPDQAGEGGLPGEQPRESCSRAEGRVTIPDVIYRGPTGSCWVEAERCSWQR